MPVLTSPAPSAPGHRAIPPAPAGRRTSSPVARYRRRMRRADALIALAWALIASSVGLFLSEGTAARFSSIGASITSLGIIAGLVGTVLVLLMLLLAARIPLLDSTFGHDRAMAIHRALGKPALYLLLSHGALVLVGYALSDGVNLGQEFLTLLSLPDMPLAIASMVLFLVVVVSSLVAVRRRFPYEMWHLIHLLSYAAVLAAAPHQFSIGSFFAQNTPQRLFWFGLYLLTFGSLLAFRVVEPLLRTLTHRLRVSEVTRIAPGVAAIRLTGHQLERLGAAGGQYFIWRFWSRSTWWHAHPISISAMPTDRELRITVRALGRGSNRLGAVRPGTFVSLQGPYGLFTDAARSAPRLAIIAAGIGVTPVRTLLENSPLRPGEATVLLRASSAEEVYHWDEVRALAVAKSARYTPLIGRRAPGSASWLPAAAAGTRLADLVPQLRETDFYICGPTAWTTLVVADALAAGVPAHRIHTERFDW